MWFYLPLEVFRNESHNFFLDGKHSQRTGTRVLYELLIGSSLYVFQECVNYSGIISNIPTRGEKLVQVGLRSKFLTSRPQTHPKDVRVGIGTVCNYICCRSK